MPEIRLDVDHTVQPQPDFTSPPGVSISAGLLSYNHRAKKYLMPCATAPTCATLVVVLVWAVDLIRVCSIVLYNI